MSEWLRLAWKLYWERRGPLAVLTVLFLEMVWIAFCLSIDAYLWESKPIDPPCMGC